MSIDQKKTIKLSVETVENLTTLIEWIPSTIKFWNKKDIFPFNLICDNCKYIGYYLAQEINKNSNNN